MKKCAACGTSSVGVFCLIDLILVMKEAGFENEIIRGVYRLGDKKEAGDE